MLASVATLSRASAICTGFGAGVMGDVGKAEVDLTKGVGFALLVVDPVDVTWGW
jgi:hypothetical protein